MTRTVSHISFVGMPFHPGDHFKALVLCFSHPVSVARKRLTIPDAELCFCAAASECLLGTAI